jgi:hypothetical protein
MSLARGKVNPLNVLGLRKLNYIPPHFGRTIIKGLVGADMHNVDSWIYRTLNSRYCIKHTQIIADTNKLTEVIEIGVEDPKELSILLLGCPYLIK